MQRILCGSTFNGKIFMKKILGMKKIFTLIAAMATTITLSAQLASDTEFKKAPFENAKTVISKTENVSWNNGAFGL